MAQQIDNEIIDQVAILAKLELTETEKQQAMEDMQKMLDYIDQLNELDTSRTEPLPHLFPIENVFREDEAVNGDDREAMLKKAPRQKAGQYQVPKTIE